MDEVIRRFNTHRIRYLVIGGQAVRLLGMPRFTMDWDVYIPHRDTENIDRINEILDDVLDMPVVPLGAGGENFVQTYQTPWGILQFLLGAPGIPRFDEAERSAQLLTTENDTAVQVISSAHLLETKRATSRAKDIEDIKFLQILLDEPDDA